MFEEKDRSVGNPLKKAHSMMSNPAEELKETAFEEDAAHPYQRMNDRLGHIETFSIEASEDPRNHISTNHKEKLQEIYKTICSNTRSLVNQSKFPVLNLLNLTYASLLLHDFIVYYAKAEERYESDACSVFIGELFCRSDDVSSLALWPNPQFWLNAFGASDPRNGGAYIISVCFFPLWMIANYFTGDFIANRKPRSTSSSIQYAGDFLGGTEANIFQDGIRWLLPPTIKQQSFKKLILKFQALQTAWDSSIEAEQNAAFHEMDICIDSLEETINKRKYLAKLHGAIGLGQLIRILNKVHPEHHNQAEYINKKERILNLLSNNKNIILSLNIAHQLWLANEPNQSKMGSIFHLLQIQMLFASLWVLGLILARSVRQNRQDNLTAECHSENKVPSQTESQHITCTECGHLEDLFLSPRDANSVEICMNTIIKRSATPEIAIERIRELLGRASKKLKKDFYFLDLSPTLIWPTQAFESLIELFINAHLSFHELKFSNTLRPDEVLSENIVRSIANLVQNIETNTLTFTKQNIAYPSERILFNAMQNRSIETVNFYDTSISHEGGQAINQGIPFYGWKSVNFGKTGNSEENICEYLCHPLSTSIHIDLSFLNLQDDSVLAIEACGEKFKTINLSGNIKISADAWDIWGDSKRNFSLNHFILDSMKFNELQQDAVNNLISKLPLENFSYQDNDLDTNFMALPFIESLPASLKGLSLDRSSISNEVFEALILKIQNSNHEKISLNGISVSEEQRHLLLRAIFQSSVKILHLKETEIDNIHASIIAEELLNAKNTNIKELYLDGNSITLEGSNKLIQAAAIQGIKILSLNHNELSKASVPNIQEAIQMGQIEKLLLNHNHLSTADAIKILKSTQESSLISLSFGSLKNTESELIDIENTLAYSPYKSDLSFFNKRDLSRPAAETRVYPRSSIQELDLELSEGQAGLDRIKRRLNMNAENVQTRAASQESHGFTNRHLLSYEEDNPPSSASNTESTLILCIGLVFLALLLRQLKRITSPQSSSQLGIFRHQPQIANDSHHRIHISNRG